MVRMTASDTGADARRVDRITRPGRAALKALADVSNELRAVAKGVTPIALGVELNEIASQVDALRRDSNRK